MRIVLNRVVLYVCYCEGLNDITNYLLQRITTNAEEKRIHQFSPFSVKILSFAVRLEEIIFIE